MNYRNTLLSICCLLLSVVSFAQKEKMTREEKDEKIQARAARIANKNDYAIFHKQMLAMKEYLDERKKIPALQKANKGIVKVVAVVDSVDDEDDAKSKSLFGVIRLDVGDNSTTVYEVTFDRIGKKIVAVKNTQEGAEADREQGDDKPVRKTTVTTKEKTVIHKKNTDDDDDDDGDEDKPAKPSKKQKDKDSDDD